MPKQLLAATSNRHKLVELRAILKPCCIECLGPDDVGGIPDVEETGTTFEANAIRKATAVATATGYTVFADDSGLEVFALGGEPGVYSARYAGADASDADRCQLLLERLAIHTDRSARFVCVVAVASPDGLIGTADGEVRGTIADAPRGTSGFGYDPVFVPDGFDGTFAELSASEKDRISHRGNALKIAVAAGLFDIQ